ncbi:hypothetical protein Anas_00225 [Armadillidium nasatum]|uniref:Uncharacterized protein n=1 Tax=Armadillidium nasatum TaxID=96803 RepID=A0A5N5TLU7_9CRUS|nr:hypothetical protein Anas_00225 [Armadillidium nasatum]
MSKECAQLNLLKMLELGSFLTGLAVLSSKASSLLEIPVTLITPLNGPLLGVFIAAYFFPKCNMKGIWSGFIFSFVLSDEPL